VHTAALGAELESHAVDARGALPAESRSLDAEDDGRERSQRAGLEARADAADAVREGAAVHVAAPAMVVVKGEFGRARPIGAATREAWMARPHTLAADTDRSVRRAVQAAGAAASAVLRVCEDRNAGRRGGVAVPEACAGTRGLRASAERTHEVEGTPVEAATAVRRVVHDVETRRAGAERDGSRARLAGLIHAAFVGGARVAASAAVVMAIETYGASREAAHSAAGEAFGARDASRSEAVRLGGTDHIAAPAVLAVGVEVEEAAVFRSTSRPVARTNAATVYAGVLGGTGTTVHPASATVPRVGEDVYPYDVDRSPIGPDVLLVGPIADRAPRVGALVVAHDVHVYRVAAVHHRVAPPRRLPAARH